jgi:hypothetical protein
LLLQDYYQDVADGAGLFRLQRHITKEHEALVGDELLVESSSDKALAARTISNQNRGANAWLRIVHMKRSLSLTQREFQLSARMCCGLMPAGLPSDLRCKCGTPLSLPHALSCKHMAARFGRHDAIVRDVFHWLRRRQVQVQMEVSGLYERQSARDRIDLLVRCEGLAYWGDVTVTEPANPSYLARSCEQAGYALSLAESRKRSVWVARAGVGVNVVPMAMESTGRMADAFVEFLGTMEQASSQGHPDKSPGINLCHMCSPE